MGGNRVSDEMLQLVVQNLAPCTLPSAAYGAEPIEWTADRPLVWAWISWPHKAAERLPARATGWNDRVVVVAWDTERGERNAVVWRGAVSRRAETEVASRVRAAGEHDPAAGSPHD